MIQLVSITQVSPEYLDYISKSLKDKDFLDVISTPEGLSAYCARVSSPDQMNLSYDKLLGYCARNSHWSVFEMVDVTFDVETTIPIASQILRHKSFSFQQFSQRYAQVTSDIVICEARRQDTKNRQKSVDDLNEETKEWFKQAQKDIDTLSKKLYNESLSLGIAKECARFLLPQNTRTRMFIKGSLRSWIHYIQVRCGNGTQKEHSDLAEEIKKILTTKVPSTAKAVGWTN